MQDKQTKIAFCPLTPSLLRGAWVWRLSRSQITTRQCLDIMENINVVCSGDPVADKHTSRSCFLLPDRWLFVLLDSADDLHGLFRGGHKKNGKDTSMGERKGANRTLYNALFVTLPTQVNQANLLFSCRTWKLAFNQWEVKGALW